MPSVPRFEHGSRVPGWDEAVDLTKEPAGVPEPVEQARRGADVDRHDPLVELVAAEAADDAGGAGAVGAEGDQALAGQGERRLRGVPGGGVEGWGLGRTIISKGGSLYARTILGIDVRETSKANAEAFIRSYDIPWPSIDDQGGATLLALRGIVPPTATPSTLVLDPKGRVAARILGPVPSAITLKDLIEDAAA